MFLGTKTIFLHFLHHILPNYCNSIFLVGEKQKFRLKVTFGQLSCKKLQNQVLSHADLILTAEFLKNVN